MIIVFIAALVGIFSLQYFYLNLTIQGLNRAVVSTPIELFYQDIDSTGVIAKWTTEDIENHLNEYYDKALRKYTNNYEVDYYFYDQYDGSMCVEKYCTAVEISVDAKLTLTYKYHRVMYYELYRSVNG